MSYWQGVISNSDWYRRRASKCSIAKENIILQGKTLNPLPPSDAVRKQKKNHFRSDLFSSVLSQLKKYHPSENRNFNNLGIFQSLKLRNLMGKIPRISLKLNCFSNISGCHGLILGDRRQQGINLFEVMIVALSFAHLSLRSAQQWKVEHKRWEFQPFKFTGYV